MEISRAEAKALGHTWYFTGVPCKRGHVARRNVANKTCFECGSLSKRVAHANSRPVISAQGWSGRFECAEEVDEYLGRDTIHCLLCWRGGYHHLSEHLRRDHGVAPAEYRRRFGIPQKRGLVSGSYSKTRASISRGNFKSLLDRRRARRSKIAWGTALERVRSGETVGEVCSGIENDPSEYQWQKRRQEQPDFDAEVSVALQGRSGQPICPATLEAVLGNLEAGCSVVGAVSGLKITDTTLYRRMQRDGVLARRFATARKTGERAFFIRRAGLLSASRRNPHVHLEAYNLALRQNELYAAVEAAVPKYLPSFMRDDVKSDLIMAVLGGEFGIVDVPREARRFVAAYNRDFGGWAPSLDADLGNGFTLGNSLAAAYI